MLLLSVLSAGQSDTGYVYGKVQTLETLEKPAQPVAHAKVSVERDAQTDLTSGKGEFRFSLDETLQPGLAATFSVHDPSVQDQSTADWLVYLPCDGVRGEVIVPSPRAKKDIVLTVVRREDPRLIIRPGMVCVLYEFARSFRPKDKGRTARNASPHPWPRGLSEQSRSSGSGAPMLLAAAYRVEPGKDGGQTPGPDVFRDTFLAKQAQLLGFTVPELEAAIEEWSRTATDPYEKGLAALYHRGYAEARAYVSESLKSSDGTLRERYVALAHAEYELGDYDAAERDLRKVLAVQKGDPVLLQDLQLILEARVATQGTGTRHNEFALSVGSAFASGAHFPPSCSGCDISVSTGVSYAGAFSHRLADFRAVSLELEFPVLGAPSRETSSSTEKVGYSSVFFTPALKLKARSTQLISPFVSIGVGFAWFGADVDGLDKSNSTGAGQIGGGVDFKTRNPLLSICIEVRDFISGRPGAERFLFSPPASPRQHNVFTGAGVVLHF